MRLLYLIIFCIIQLAGITCSFADSCVANGFKPVVIQSSEQQIAKALSAYDAQLFADQVTLPLTIHLQYGTRTVTQRQEMITLFQQLFSQKEARLMGGLLSKKSSTVICRAEGVGLFNGQFWLTMTKQGALKISVINSLNANIAANTILGKAILPISDKKTLQLFLAAYQRVDPAQAKSLSIVKRKNGGFQFVDKVSSSNIVLYKADINNMGRLQYLLSYNNGGSLNVDVIMFVGQLSNGRLRSLSFAKALQKGLNVSTEQWYLHHNVPFLTNWHHQVVMHFDSNRYGICSYFWRGDKLQFFQGASQCIGYSDKIYATK